MRRFTALFLLGIILILNINVFAQKDVSIDKNTSVKATEESKEEKKEIRDQNILVPTKDGVQKATAEEAGKIEEYEKYSLEELSKSYLLGDYQSGKILEAYNIDEVRPMASTSKLVSIFVVFDKIKDGTISKSDELTIDRESSILGGSTFKLKENDKMTVDDLIKASMVVSGNDAITALAKHISGSVEAFSVLMNKKCKDLGLKNAHMVNPTGLTNYAIEDYNKMTTREMFILSCELIKYYPEILNYTKEAYLKDEDRNFLEYNTNPILGIVPEIDGLKTGYTNASGRTVISTGLKKGIEGKSKDLRLVGIVTGCNGDWQRYVAIKRLMSKGFDNYEYTIFGTESKPIQNINVENAQDAQTPVFIKSKSYALVNKKENIKKDIKIISELKAPIEAGKKVGTIKYYSSGDLIFESDLIVKDKVYEKGILQRFVRIYEDIFKNIEREVSWI